MIKKSKFVFITAIFVILLDQFAKLLVMSYLQLNQSLPIIKNFLHLTHITNTGSAFGLLKGFNLALIAVSFIVILVIFHYVKRIKQSERLLQFAVGLLLGGTIGNVIDRIFYGHVIDFIDFRVWPVFNFADSAITVSVILLVLIFWKE